MVATVRVGIPDSSQPRMTESRASISCWHAMGEMGKVGQMGKMGRSGFRVSGFDAVAAVITKQFGILPVRSDASYVPAVGSGCGADGFALCFAAVAAECCSV